MKSISSDERQCSWQSCNYRSLKLSVKQTPAAPGDGSHLTSLRLYETKLPEKVYIFNVRVFAHILFVWKAVNFSFTLSIMYFISFLMLILLPWSSLSLYKWEILLEIQREGQLNVRPNEQCDGLTNEQNGKTECRTGGRANVARGTLDIVFTVKFSH